MTNKATLDEIAIVDNIIAHLREAIDEEVHDDGPCAKPIVLRMMEIPAKTLLRRLEICREQAARLAEWESFRAQFDDLSYHHSGMGCGIEDRGITDRYEACEHGWEAAMEQVAERMPEEQ